MDRHSRLGEDVRRLWNEAMRRLAEIPDASVARWIQRGRLAAAAYAAVAVFVGVIYIIAMLAGGAWGAGFVGLVAMIGGCGLAGVAWMVLRLAETSQSTVEALERLRQRVDMMESTVELHSAQAGLSATLVDDLSALVAGKLEGGGYPRIVRHEEAEADEETTEDAPEVARIGPAAEAAEDRSVDFLGRFEALLAAGDLSACHDILPNLDPDMTDSRVRRLRAEYDKRVAERAKALRGQFADLVRHQSYTAAIRAGDEIAALLPESRMASDFRGIRSLLERRASAAPPSRAIS